MSDTATDTVLLTQEERVILETALRQMGYIQHNVATFLTPVGFHTLKVSSLIGQWEHWFLSATPDASGEHPLCLFGTKAVRTLVDLKQAEAWERFSMGTDRSNFEIDIFRVG